MMLKRTAVVGSLATTLLIMAQLPALAVADDLGVNRTCAISAANPVLTTNRQVVGSGSVACSTRHDVIVVEVCLDIETAPGVFEEYACGAPSSVSGGFSVNGTAATPCVVGTHRYKTRSIGNAFNNRDLKFDGTITSNISTFTCSMATD